MNVARVAVGVLAQSNVWTARNLRSRVVACVNAPVRTRATIWSPWALLLSTWSQFRPSTSWMRRIAPAAIPNVLLAALAMYSYFPYIWIWKLSRYLWMEYPRQDWQGSSRGFGGTTVPWRPRSFDKYFEFLRAWVKKWDFKIFANFLRICIKNL